MGDLRGCVVAWLRIGGENGIVAAPYPPPPLTPIMRRIYPLLLSLFALLLLVAAYLLFAPKFREIGDYRVYRSAQLSAAGLHQRIEARQLVAVLNLRGPNPERAWYQAQQQILAEQQVQSLDLPLSARTLPDILLLQRLVAALEELPRPFLLHCQHGNDRSGLAAALLHLADPNSSLERAWGEVSPWRGTLHPDSVGRQFLRQYQQWLEREQLAHHPDHYRRFIATGYRDAQQNLRLSLDRIAGEPPRERVEVAPSAPLTLEGWAFDPLTGETLASIELLYGERVLPATQQQLPRPDVVATFGADTPEASGWLLQLAPLPSDLRGCAPLNVRLTRRNGSSALLAVYPETQLCIR